MWIVSRDRRTRGGWLCLGRGIGPAWLVLLLTLASVPVAYGEKYALLVGVNEYSNVRSLGGSVNDIERVRELLLGDLGFEEERIRILTDADDTKEKRLFRKSCG